jgi:tetratricopeptide (TPR) repeat protein
MQKLLLALFFILLYSCAPQVTEPINKPKEQPPTPEPEYEDNICTTLQDLEPALRSDTEDAYVIYRDYMRAKDYNGAFPIWKKAYYTAPAANGRIRYQFEDGITIYKAMLDNTNNASDKQAYADSIASVYNKWMECFPEDKYTVQGKKAFNYYYDLKDYADEDDVFVMFKSSFDGKGNDADYFIINPFSRMLYDRVLREEIPIKEASKYALKIFDIIEKNLSDCETDACEPWEIINDYAPGLLSGLEGIKGFYPCDYFSDRYYDQYLANSEDCENITEVFVRLRFGDCPQNDPKMVTLRNAKDKNCYVPPEPEGPLKKAYRALNDGQFKEAVALYDEFLSTSDDSEKKAEIRLRVAKIYYVHLRNFNLARKYALEAAQTKNNWGEPYILIGKLYASSGPLCGPGRGWDSQIVTWPAIDKFEQARRIDPSASSEATKLINQYRQYMPSKEDIFFRRMNEGDSFRVNCWIQENTTIRAAP